LVRAGVMVVAEGLEASSKGARVKFEGSKRTVIDGPFAESKELIGGFWIWELKSKAEAIEWLKRAPFQDGEVEIRQLLEAEDFGGRLSERREGEGLVWGAEVVDRAGDGVSPGEG
ncbi:MAG: YciI family protein, partial [Myxococcaceae bacterium]